MILRRSARAGLYVTTRGTLSLPFFSISLRKASSLETCRALLIESLISVVTTIKEDVV